MLFVANWKMYKSYTDAVTFIQTHHDDLDALAHTPGRTIIICPSHEAVAPIATQCKDTSVNIGAQDCSAHKLGAYTGQIAAASLSQIGCTYCIVGHSERRAVGESSALVAEKTVRLIEQNICPIVCIGETALQYQKKQTKNILTEQLTPIAQHIIHAQYPNTKLVIAYEPVWAIGTNVVPTRDYLLEIYDWLANWCATQLPQAHITLLYGGSVQEQNAQQLAQLASVGGFLIGGASTDFQKLQKIVSLVQE